jgi:predicted dithiol-disulfide oxidoreductase (DUF899 family)
LGTTEKSKEKEMQTRTLDTTIKGHTVVSHDDWLSARAAFLKKEKEFTRLREELSRSRRQLPWERVEKQYLFDGPKGQQSLSDLFENRSQLVVYHFMFAPEWDAGCPHCSFWADNFSPIIVHLNHRDATMVAVSRAPQAKIEAFRKRMGWTFHWLSSGKNTFNYDFGVSFTPESLKNRTATYNYQTANFDHQDREGASVFYKGEDGSIFHTYSTYARGIDILNTAYNYLDLVPKGRDEENLEFTQSWVRYHDKYQD